VKTRNKVRKKRKKNVIQPEPSYMGLGLLISLLNSESVLEFIDETLEEDEHGWWHPLHFNESWLKKAWRMRRVILDDLSPLIEGKSRSRAENHLNLLLKKINDMKFKPYWDVWPAGKIGVMRLKNPAYEKLGPGQAVLKLGKFRGIVTMEFDIVGDPKRYFYGTIAESLQNGRLNRLKRCQWERCRKLYFAYDGRRTIYCSGGCAKAYDKNDAKERVRKYREGL